MNRLDYGEYIFQQLLMTKFVQQKLTIILMSIFVNIIQMHLVTIVCLILTFNPIVDFVLHTAISIIFTLNISFIYNITERYKVEFHNITQYLIANYSFENYRYWKRIIVCTICAYACVILYKTAITSWLLFIYIIQYAICFIVVDQIEEQRFQLWIKDWLETPIIRNNDKMTNKLIESYMSSKNGITQIKQGELKHSFNNGLVKQVNYNMNKSLILKKNN